MPSIALIVVTIASDAVMYVTLPVHIRLLFVLLRSSKKVQLEGSFYTLMIHTTIVNLLFSLVFCFIQAPAATGVLFGFYEALGPHIAKVEMIKSTTVLLVGSAFHLVLALSRFTAISRPAQHGSVTTNVFGVPAIEFTFLGNYFLIYSIGSSSVGALMEVVTIVCYAGMLAKFREFTALSKSFPSDLQRLTAGVIRTTLAAMCSSMGSWIIVFFFLVCSLYQVIAGDALIRPTEFSAVFGLLNTINNILTPWVLIIMFPSVRKRLFMISCALHNAGGSSE